MSDLLNLIKKAAIEAVQESSPVKVVYGEVISESPLKIKVEQKYTLTKEFLVLTNSVVDHEVDLKIKDSNQEFETYEVKAGLKSGDKVVMLREEGGQRFVVIDKVVS